MNRVMIGGVISNENKRPAHAARAHMDSAQYPAEDVRRLKFAEAVRPPTETVTYLNRMPFVRAYALIQSATVR